MLGDDFLDKIKQYREMFPPVRLPSKQMARQSVQELKDKFVWFFKNNPEYNWTIVLDATDYYIQTKKQDGYLYMATSSNFIQKTDNNTKLVKSTLADYCQMFIDNPDNITL